MPLPEALSSRTQDRSYWERLRWFCLISLKVVDGFGRLVGGSDSVGQSDVLGSLLSGAVTCEETMRSGKVN